MPTGAVESFAKKYNVSVEIAEREWKSAKKLAEKQYGTPSKSPKSDKGKDKNEKIYGTAMNIFKNKMESHHGSKNENRLLRFDYFLNEFQVGHYGDYVENDAFDTEYQYKKEEGEWQANLFKIITLFDNEHKKGPKLETDIPKYVKLWLNYKQESQDFAPELTKYVEKKYLVKEFLDPMSTGLIASGIGIVGGWLMVEGIPYLVGLFLKYSDKKHFKNNKEEYLLNTLTNIKDSKLRTWMPKNEDMIVIEINGQQLHIYRNKIQLANTNIEIPINEYDYKRVVDEIEWNSVGDVADDRVMF